MEQQEKNNKSIRKLKKQLKFYVKKVEDYEGKVVRRGLCSHVALPSCSCSVMRFTVSLPCSASAQQKYSASAMNPVRAVNITRKERDYRGMLEYREGDESRLLKNVVTGMFDLFFFFYYLIPCLTSHASPPQGGLQLFCFDVL